MFIKTWQDHLVKEGKDWWRDTRFNCKFSCTFEICLKAPYILLVYNIDILFL